MTTPRRAPRVPFALLVVGLVLGGLVLLLALNTASAANELKRHDLASRDQRVAAQVQQLRNEVAVSAAPGNLAQAAAALGMVPAGNPAFIVLGADGSAKVLGKPRAVVGVPILIDPAPTATTARPTPTVTPTASKTQAAPKTATSTKSPTGTKSPASTRTPSGTKTPVKSSGAPKTPPKPTPTPTPTPTLTLPGGNR